MVGAVHGGVKFYRGCAKAARNYVEADRSRADDYYLAEGSGIAQRYVATNSPTVGVAVGAAGELDGDGYETWVAGYDTSGVAKGRLRTDKKGLRFVEVVVNGPKTWSLAASLHPEIADAYDAAQERAAVEIIGWLAEHSTTRVGPRGLQIQVPVERLEAAVVRHYTSRAGDPHRHLHLQVNARVFAQGGWRGLHSVGVVDSIEAINGIGHAAVMCDPEFRTALAAYGYTLDAESGEITQLAPFAGEFSHRAAQIGRHVDRYEAQWRADHPGQEPSAALRRAWDRRAWAEARPDKVVPTDGAELVDRWREELHDLGFQPPRVAAGLSTAAVGGIDRESVTDLVQSRLGARRSAWNSADIRGEVERIVAAAGVVAEPVVRRELVEDLTARTINTCLRLVDRDDAPEHIRSLSSKRVVAVEKDLVDRIARRADKDSADPSAVRPVRVGPVVARRRLDPGQRQVVTVLVSRSPLVVVEGAAGAGKTTTLAVAASVLGMDERRMVVVTPTLRAARVAEAEVGSPASSAAWLAHQYGYRWDGDGRWTREPFDIRSDRHLLDPRARLMPGDLLLVDEAGMLDQDTAHALFTIADETGARIALMGDRHQLPAVGRGGVLDHATRWTPTHAQVALDTVHRFTDPAYADLSLLMREGNRPVHVFDHLLERGDIVIHPTEVERTAALIEAGAAGATVITDTRDQVADLNAGIRDRHHADHRSDHSASSNDLPVSHTQSGEPVWVGDLITTRRNDRDLDVANRDRWTVTGTDRHGNLEIRGDRGSRTLPREYTKAHVELAYATTVHGAQGDTVDHAHFALNETTGAAATYVAMTRGRHSNTAHLVADTIDDAREQWLTTFNRDRADLGPARARERALDDIDRYGPTPRRTRPEHQLPPPGRQVPPSPTIGF
ncbi:MobF family relaxase [Nocardioides sp. L-11A]|uniref:MobF family relaxase n=1 Tax=Nocardioides sp. L-11A TaxID=3043848 RepID=UPI00249BA7BF|nr:MobF family relaxase [Nocardioides sp. L-11A]